MWTERMSPVFMHSPAIRDECWGALWKSRNRDDGVKTRLVCSHYTCGPALFRTKALAAAWIKEQYGYIRERPDLRERWRMPIPVRVEVTVRSAK
jgi:hypothetical protein